VFSNLDARLKVEKIQVFTVGNGTEWPARFSSFLAEEEPAE
jgi:hypothetical protein